MNVHQVYGLSDGLTFVTRCGNEFYHLSMQNVPSDVLDDSHSTWNAFYGTQFYFWGRNHILGVIFVMAFCRCLDFLYIPLLFIQPEGMAASAYCDIVKGQVNMVMHHQERLIDMENLFLVFEITVGSHHRDRSTFNFLCSLAQIWWECHTFLFVFKVNLSFLGVCHVL